MSDTTELWQVYFADRSDENRNRLATHYFTFVRKTVRSMAKEYTSLGRFDIDDMESWALEALLRSAIPNYRPDRGASPETFIRQTIFMRFKGEIRRARQAEKRMTISLDAGRGVQGHSLNDVLSGPDTQPIDQLIEAEEPTLYTPLHAAVAKLSSKQREIVEAVFWEGRSNSEIAQQNGVSREAVHWNLSRALERLRKILGVRPDMEPSKRRKPTPAKIRMICEKHASGASIRSIARDVDLGFQAVKRIIAQQATSTVA